jgi:cytochrome b involved in lipid metabolism
VFKEQEQAVMATTTRKALSATTDTMVDGSTSTSSLILLNADNEPRCDACPLCDDVCDNPKCSSCQEKSSKDLHHLPAASSPHQQQQRFFTLCQVRRHNHEGSAWIVAGKAVYDVTSYLDRHPAGSACILSVAGGQQNVMHSLKRHKRYAQKKWETFRIGTLKKCDCEKMFGGAFCCV